MRRREFITLIGGAAAWPLGAHAQQRGKVWRIGYLEGGSPATRPELVAAFRQKLRDLGYQDPQYFIDAKYSEGRDDRLAELAAEIVRGDADVILAVGPQPAFAAATATKSIPIVFVGVGDPVGTKLVTSLARPGANVTGLSVAAVELVGKRLELLTELVPRAKRIGIIWNPNSSVNVLELDAAKQVAAALGLTPIPVEARVVEDFEGAFSAMVREGAEATFILSSPLIFPNRRRIATIAINSHLPAACALREYAIAGCLVSYGPSYVEHFRRAAAMIDRIFKGTKPSDLPVEQPTTYELVFNQKTANALGLKIPPTLLTRADGVIE